MWRHPLDIRQDQQEAPGGHLPLCDERGAVVAGGGFNSGSLATGTQDDAGFSHAAAPPDIMNRVRRIEAVCADRAQPPAAAALLFVVAHPVFPEFIAGTRTQGRPDQNPAWFSRQIPAAFRADLKARRLLRDDAPTPP